MSGKDLYLRSVVDKGETGSSENLRLRSVADKIVSVVLIIEGEGAGSGIGSVSVEALINILVQARGSGIGEATTQALALVVLTSEEFATLQTRIVELELALKPRAHFRV